MANSTTAVDLSRLPAPTVIEQLSFEAIFGEMVARVQSLLPAFDATVESDPAVKLLQVAAYRELLIRQQFNDNAQQLLVAFATGANLDHLAAFFGETRLVLAEADPERGTEAQLETDEAFRERVLLAPESYTVAGPVNAYIAAARRASGDVLHASATSPTPGQVIVAVLSRIGDGTASPELIAAVEAVANADDVRPLTDQVIVQSAQIIPFAITAQLRMFTGPDPELVRNTAQARAQTYANDCHRLGRRVVLSAIIGALQVEGVEEVILTNPPAPIEIDQHQAPYCSAINVTIA